MLLSIWTRLKNDENVANANDNLLRRLSLLVAGLSLETAAPGDARALSTGMDMIK